ncbi:hypothetical protein JX266_010640 [Neoarthrinium moseri]|nr:hypothetical protein JX266_010640 [Neoarthrinium moseri]
MNPSASRSPTSSKNPRKRPASSTSRAPSTKAKKRKSRAAPPQETADEDQYWTIKGILRQKTEKRKLYYLIEWEGIDESTGRAYKPTWEPAENITSNAIAEWEEKQQQAQGGALASCDETAYPLQAQAIIQEPGTRPWTSETRTPLAGVFAPGSLAEVREAKRRRLEQRRDRRDRTLVLDSQDAEDTEEPSLGVPARTTAEAPPENLVGSRSKITVELSRRPGFNPNDYQQVQLSQASQSQTATQSSQTLSSQVSSPEVGPALGHLHSNRTIPDSQEVSGYSISDTTNSGPGADLYALTKSQDSVPKLAARSRSEEATVPDSLSHIPSRQLEPAASQSGTILFESASAPPAGPPFGDISNPAGDESQATHSAASLSRGPQFTQDPGFLSQVPFHFDESALPTPSGQEVDSQREQPPEPTSQILQTSGYSTPAIASESHRLSQASPQAAQIVPRFASHSEAFQSQIAEPDFSVYSDHGESTAERDEVIPETAHLASRTVQFSQNSSQALSELDGNTKISSSAPQSYEHASPSDSLHVHISKQSIDKLSEVIGVESLDAAAPRFLSSKPLDFVLHSSDRTGRRSSLSPRRSVTPTGNMDDAPTTSSTPMSMKEKLRLIRERNLGPRNSNQVPNLAVQEPANTLADDHTAHPEQLAEFAEPLISPSILVPSVETDHPEDAALHADFVEEHKPADHLPMETHMFESSTIPTSFDAMPEEQPATLDPAALTLSIDPHLTGLAPAPELEPELEQTASPSIPTDDDQMPNDHHESVLSNSGDHEASNSNVLPNVYIEDGADEHILTLPLASNIRPQYVEIIKETNDDLVAYNAAFTTPPFSTPEPELVAKVDRMFERLFDVCDLPPFLETLPQITPVQVTKHVRNTNSKFSFVGHFLENLCNVDSQKSVLILARPGKIIELLNNLVTTEGYHHVQLRGSSLVESPEPRERPTVMVASTSDDLTLIHKDFDVIIAFDHTFRQDLLPTRNQEAAPIVLALVTSASIQHINMRISEKIEPLGRKNYLMLALCASVEEITHPEGRFPQAHEVAELFSNYVENPDDEEFYWTPQELPQSIFEHIAASSQAEGTNSSLVPIGVIGQPPSRKRSLVSTQITSPSQPNNPNKEQDDQDETEPKRPRIAQPNVITTTIAIRNIPESLGGLIGESSNEGKPTVGITVEQAEALAAKIAKLEAELEKMRGQRDVFRDLADRTKSEVENWTASMNRIQPRYMAALRDRGIFQKKVDDSFKEKGELSLRVQSHEKEILILRETNTELQRKLSEAEESLIKGENPELAKMVQMERDTEDAKKKAADFEKKLNLSQSDCSYAREQYQQASQRALELKKENDELNKHVIELTRKADNNIVMINQNQDRNEVRELKRLLEDKSTIIREREAELNRVHQQLASAKNGRRETRQSSVPRSPRLGVSSPRTGRGGAVVPSGSASRGASPAAPAGTFETGGSLMPGIGSLFAGQQQGNGRFAHLRE